MRKVFLILGLLLISFGASTHTAHADGYYILRVPAHDGWCDRNGFTTHIQFSWSVPPGDVFVHNVSIMNGVSVRDETFVTGLPRTGSTLALFFPPATHSFPQLVPYTFDLMQTWYTKAGGTFARTRTTLICERLGSVPIVLEYPSIPY